MASFSNVHTTRDLTRLSQFLTQTLEKAGVTVPDSSGDGIRLLNLACGRADETEVLAKVFGHKADAIHLTGIDIRAREIAEAGERWKKLPDGASADFFVQDASQLGHLKELGKNFDIAFMRHQNFWNGDMTWTRIYDEALHRLDEDGLLVITSYFDREHRLALDAIQRLGAELVCSERNQHSRVICDAPNKSVDRHIAVFRKPR
jgi:SAM-dependent methyltransferase